MSIALSNSNINSVYVGNKQVTKACLGNDIIFTSQLNIPTASLVYSLYYQNFTTASWVDSSPNGNNGLISGSLYNSGSNIAFDGSQFLYWSDKFNNVSSSFTLTVYGKFPSDPRSGTSATTRGWSLWSKKDDIGGTTGWTTTISPYQATTTYPYKTYRHWTGDVTIDAEFIPWNADAINNYTCMTLVVKDGLAVSSSLFVDNQKMSSSYSPTIDAFNENTGSSLYFGRGLPVGSSLWPNLQGNIKAILFYSSSLSDTEVGQLHASLTSSL